LRARPPRLTRYGANIGEFADLPDILPDTLPDTLIDPISLFLSNIGLLSPKNGPMSVDWRGGEAKALIMEGVSGNGSGQWLTLSQAADIG